MPAHLTSTPTTRAITVAGRRWEVVPELDACLNLQVKSKRTTAPVRWHWDLEAGELTALIRYGVRANAVATIRGEDALVLRNWRLDIKHGLWPKRD